MTSKTFNERELEKIEQKIDELRKLIPEAREKLEARIRLEPDLAVRAIPATIREQLRKALELYDELNAFFAQLRNA